MPELTREASQTIAKYLKHVREEIKKAAPGIAEPQVMDFLEDTENEIIFLTFRLSKARNSNRVDKKDIQEGLKKTCIELYRNRKIFTMCGQRILSDLDFLKKTVTAHALGEIRLLDVGCGWGRAGVGFAKGLRGMVELVGIDVDVGSLDYGKSLNDHVSFVKSDMKHMPFKKSVFDAVFSRKSLHEAGSGQERDIALSEISQVLKPKGVIYVLDPFVRFRLIKSVRHVLHKILKIDEYSNTREFESAMRNNGLVITRKSCIAWPSLSPSLLCSYLAMKMHGTSASTRSPRMTIARRENERG